MIIPMRWCDVGGGMRVILSSGRTVHVLDRVPGLDGLVLLRNGAGRTAPIQVDPQAVVPVVFDQQDAAVAVLKARFGRVEFIGELS